MPVVGGCHDLVFNLKSAVGISASGESERDGPEHAFAIGSPYIEHTCCRVDDEICYSSYVMGSGVAGCQGNGNDGAHCSIYGYG